MALPAKTRTILAQVLSSEGLERLQLEAAKASRRFAGQPHVLRFFYDPESPISWMMAQVLLQLQASYHVVVQGHTVYNRLSQERPRNIERRVHSLAEAQVVAKWFGLKGPDRLPDSSEVETVAAELLSLEGTPQWLEQAVHLGLATFCSTSLPNTMQDLSGLERNHTLLIQMGHRRPGTVNLAGLWFEDVDGLLRLQEHLISIGAGSEAVLKDGGGPLPKLARGPIRFWFRFGDPYCYLAFKQLEAVAVRNNLDVEYLPTASSYESVDLPLRRQAAAVMEVGREARRLNVPFGNVSGYTPKSSHKILDLFYGLENDPERQRQLIHNTFNAVWVRGLNLNDPKVQLNIASSVGLSELEATKLLLLKPFGERAEQNAEALLHVADRVQLPATQIGDLVFFGHQRFELVEALVKASIA